MKSKILQCLYGSFWTADALWAALQAGIHREKPGVICLLLHNPFQNKAEAHSGKGYPGEGITQDLIARCLAWFQRKGYRFIHPHECNAALENKEHAVLLSFDDAYYNCTTLLPVLEKYAAPAAFYVTTRPVLEQKVFWWDALWRGEFRNGGNATSASSLTEKLKDLPYAEIEQELLGRYGDDAFKIEDDAFRPMTSSELRDFSRHPLVSLGNHTHEHVALDICSAQECENQIATAQREIEKWTGVVPASMAYPYGRYVPETLQVVRSHGFTLGLSCNEGKNEYGDCDHLQLKRFDPQGYWGMRTQCYRYCADKPLTPKLMRAFQRILSWRNRKHGTDIDCICRHPDA